MNSIAAKQPNNSFAGIRFSPTDIARRRAAGWEGTKVETIEITHFDRFGYSVKSRYHVLVASERAERDDGETGFQKSTQREFSHKLSFIPAGYCFHG
jgi:AraC family transcriptional regulator